MFDQYMQALQQRKKENWSLGRWYEQLDELGIDYGNSRENLGSDGGAFSTQDIALFEPADITLTMTYEQLVDGNTGPIDSIELQWEFDDSGVDDAYTGEPKDGAKIGYQPKYYDKPQDLDGSDAYEFGSNTVSLAGNNAYNEGGLAAEYEGLYIDIQNPILGDGETGGDLDRKDWMKVFVVPDEENYSAYDRTIYFGYTMTYDDAELTGASIGSDGIIQLGVTESSSSWSEVVGYEEIDVINGKEYSP